MLARDLVRRISSYCLTTLALGFAMTWLVPAAHAQGIVLLHAFSGPDGSQPEAGLIMDGRGNLYGTTQLGGSSGDGTGFELSYEHSSWILTTLYTFRGGQDGAKPLGRVVFGPDGALYGTTSEGGGAGNFGTVFRLNPSATVCHAVQCPWTETVLYSFTGGSDGAYPQFVDLAFDSAGNIYGTTGKGGQYCDVYGSCGTVFKLTKSGQQWIETTLYAFSGGSDGAVPYGGVALDSHGNLYGTTGFGGANGFGTVFEVTTNGSGWSETVLHSFDTISEDGESPFAGVVLDAQGNIYGTTLLGGASDSGTAYELLRSPSGWIYLSLASFSASYSGPNGVPTLFDGVIFGVTQNDGANSSGNVYALVNNGGQGSWTNLDLFDFGGQLSQYGVTGSGAVVLDSSFNVYGTTATEGAHDNGVIWEYEIY